MILFSCRRVAEISSKELDTRLRLTELLCASGHRLICAPCRRYRAQLLAMEEATREYLHEALTEGNEPLPEHAKARIRALLGSETE